MTEYERRRWDELNKRWEKRAKPSRVVPERARQKVADASRTMRDQGGRLTGAVERLIPERVSEAARGAGDAVGKGAGALLTAAASLGSLVDLLNDWIGELQDPASVIRYHQENGRPVETIADVANLDLEVLDHHTRRLALTWRSVGVAEGAGLGALAMIPVPVVGSVAAVGLDLVAMQALATSIAIRVCHSYGFDVRDSEMDEVVEAMVRRNYGAQASKMGAVHQAGVAFDATRGRIRWSEALRRDQKLLAAVEKLMQHARGGASVPLKNARMALPGISVVVGAGVNQQILGQTAELARDYAATLFLARKYDLDLPPYLQMEV